MFPSPAPGSLRTLVTLVLVLITLAACSSDGGGSETGATDRVSTGAGDPPVTTAPVESNEPDTTPTEETPETTPTAPPDATPAATQAAPTAVPDRIAAPPTPPAELGPGSEGSSVAELQDLLNDLIGYVDLDLDQIAEDGVYGPNTDIAQRAFERYAELPDDGVATLEERALLDEIVTAIEASTSDSIVALGDESLFVGTWQRRLNAWNDLVLELPVEIVVDDRFGPDTEAATLAVERALGLQVDGIVEPEDRTALRSAIAQVRAESDVTVLERTAVDDQTVLVRALFDGDGYCLRFVVGFAADERCTETPGGDLNTAYFVTINEVSFVAGTANPNVAFVQLGDDRGGLTPVATRRFGDSLARGWVQVVDDRPDTVELLEADGSSVVELNFSLEPTDRDFFGATISVLSPEYSQTFFIDACTRSDDVDLIIEASLADAEMVVTVNDGAGTLVIAGGTDAAPVQITGTIDAADITVDAVAVTGEFGGQVFDDAAFTATANC